ncbi:esterase/lipase family protein [Dyella sp.]|uniref:esterase/lipase family protein n=1 Tax=Dyella sp. TaxID=1869338 RepID=UPI002D7A3CA5|nr:alpha/beta fold hydrolase [Dyella sp.]HET6433177.1 alpha/beta fold hydrolase [Dyella sp.]
MLPVLLAIQLGGCALVQVRQDDPRSYDENRRGDILTTGALSFATRNAIARLGLAPERCGGAATACIQALRAATLLDHDAQLAALAELTLGEALKADRAGAVSAPRRVGAYLDAARCAYAYLFFGDRSPRERAFEDRQTQVRDAYNYAVERVAALMFEQGQRAGRFHPPVPGSVEAIDGWQLRYGSIDLVLPRGAPKLEAMVPASRLRIDGLASVYRRDGLGAEVVMVARPAAGVAPSRMSPFADTGYLPATVLLRFPGASLAQVLDGHEAVVDALDPYRRDSTAVAGQVVPLAANFSAPYALWLADAGFGRKAIDNLLGRDNALDRPRVFLMQPYDPRRLTVVMIHGLASSPEAWVNLANEVMGDEALRQRYQIWEVYYPTNAPIPVNLVQIRAALAQTFAALDPLGTAPASHHVTLVGHSMGGVIARLLVVNSGDALWQRIFRAPVDSPRRKRLATLAPYLSITPLPGVDEAIFLAAPHAGTPIAGHWLARVVTRLIRLPKTLLETSARIAEVLAGELPEQAALFRTAPTGVDLLRDSSPYLRATSTLPIVDGVRYHSIIARRSAGVPLAESTDGFVPYASAHLAGAASEKIIMSGHSVQETPQAILEIRRILREHAGVGPADTAPPAQGAR